jgi:hypothetical protein
VLDDELVTVSRTMFVIVGETEKVVEALSSALETVKVSDRV